MITHINILFRNIDIYRRARKKKTHKMRKFLLQELSVYINHCIPIKLTYLHRYFDEDIDSSLLSKAMLGSRRNPPKSINTFQLFDCTENTSL